MQSALDVQGRNKTRDGETQFFLTSCISAQFFGTKILLQYVAFLWVAIKLKSYQVSRQCLGRLSPRLENVRATGSLGTLLGFIGFQWDLHSRRLNPFSASSPRQLLSPPAPRPSSCFLCRVGGLQQSTGDSSHHPTANQRNENATCCVEDLLLVP